MKKISLHIIVAVCCLLLAPSSIGAQSSVDEYYAKAGFIYNFIKFIEWPGEYSLSRRSSVNICVMGKNPFGKNLDIIRQSSTARLKLNVVTEVADSQITGCHVLFISKSEEARLKTIITTVSAYPVLTIGESDGFAIKGGVVGFRNIEKTIGNFSKNKIVFEINNDTAKRAGLIIDPQLLEIAHSVIGK